MAIVRESRLIENAVRQVAAAEPAMREVQVDLIAVPPLGPEIEALTDQEHKDQQLGIDRRAASVAVETRQIAADAPQIDKAVDGAKLVILSKAIFPGGTPKTTPAALSASAQHRQSSRLYGETESALRPQNEKSFSTQIAQLEARGGRSEKLYAPIPPYLVPGK